MTFAAPVITGPFASPAPAGEVSHAMCRRSAFGGIEGVLSAGAGGAARRWAGGRYKAVILFLGCMFAAAGCAPSLHTGMAKSEMAAVLGSTFELGMPEREVVDGIERLGMKAEYGTNWHKSLKPDVAAFVPDRDPHFVYPYGAGMLAFTFDPIVNTLTRVEYVTLTRPRKPRDWWPEDPETMLGEIK